MVKDFNPEVLPKAIKRAKDLEIFNVVRSPINNKFGPIKKIEITPKGKIHCFWFNGWEYFQYNSEIPYLPSIYLDFCPREYYQISKSFEPDQKIEVINIKDYKNYIHKLLDVEKKKEIEEIQRNSLRVKDLRKLLESRADNDFVLIPSLNSQDGVDSYIQSGDVHFMPAE